MAEFETYKAILTCRDCGEEFEGLSFFPEVVKRYGLCETCAYADQEKAKAREKPLTEKPKDVELDVPRRIWEPE